MTYATVQHAGGVLGRLGDVPVGNDQKGDVAHLWDEVVGYYATHTGVALLVLAVVAAIPPGLRVAAPWGIAVAVAVGLTHGTNALEGGTAAYGLVVATLLIAWGVRRGDATGRVLAGAYGLAALLICAYGVWQGGFPQPSAVGIGL